MAFKPGSAIARHPIPSQVSSNFADLGRRVVAVGLDELHSVGRGVRARVKASRSQRGFQLVRTLGADGASFRWEISIQHLDSGVPDEDVFPASAEFLETDMPLARAIFDRRGQRAIVAFDFLVLLGEVQVLNHFSIEHDL